MGKQFQTYLLPEDASALLAEVRKSVDLRILASHSDDSCPHETPVVSKIVGGFSRIDCCLAPTFESRIEMQHIEAQHRWDVDSMVSDVIEFSGCHFDGKTLKRGRMFFDTGFYSEDGWEDKSVKFRNWANKLFRVSKKSLVFSKTLNAYIGTAANLWIQGGGTIVPVSFGGKLVQ